MSNYHLPLAYKPNPPFAHDSGPYWTPKRIHSSSHFQYHVYRWARAIADQHGAKRIADIGCGPGTKLVHFFDDNFERFGYDQQEAIDICRSRYQSAHFEVMDLNQKTQGAGFDQKFDIVICADVIEHLEHPEQLLHFIRQVSTPKTKIILSTPDRVRLNGGEVLSPSNAAHVREWRADELTSFLTSNRFMVEQTQFFPLLKSSLSVRGLRQRWHALFSREQRFPNITMLCALSEHDET